MIPRKTGSETSARIASIAGRGLRDPKSLTPEEIREVCGAALEQREPPTIPIRPRTPPPPPERIKPRSPFSDRLLSPPTRKKS